VINIVSIMILILGVFAPHITNGRLPALFLFWIGGMMCFSSGLLVKPGAAWAKWTRLGILTNVACFVLMLAIFYITIERPMTRFEQWLTMIPYWLAKPATALGQQLFPYPEIQKADGSLIFHMGFSRTVFADLLDVGLFAAIAMGIGMLPEMRHREKRTGVEL
jgi:hypothetical protein